MSETVNHFGRQLIALALVGDEQINKNRLTPSQRIQLQLCIDTMHSTATYLLDPQEAERLYHSADDDAPIQRSQAAGLPMYLTKQAQGVPA